MKKYIIIILILLVNTVFAQQEAVMDKATSGRYSQGSNGGIYAYDDGTFALFGYATLVWGNYTIDNNQINFTPTIPEQAFTILGRKNTNIKNGIRLTFSSDFINDGPTYIKYDNESLIPLSDDKFSAGYPHYTTNLDYHPATISLIYNRPNNLYQYNTNTFKLDDNYNDYLLFYNKTIREQEPFSATLINDKGKVILQSRWGNFVKQVSERDEEWEAFLTEHKKQQRKSKNATVLYFNNQLKSANGFSELSEKPSIFDINNYVLDEGSNKFIRKDIYQKGKDYNNAIVKEYHDESIILKFDNILVSQKTETDFGEVQISSKPIFTSETEPTSTHENTEQAVEVYEEAELLKIYPTEAKKSKTPVLKNKKKKK
jgi:hypothetical protein